MHTQDITGEQSGAPGLHGRLRGKDGSRTRRALAVVVVAVAAVAAAGSLRAEDWPQWRGPAFNGTSQEKNLPVTFSRTDGVQWTAPMPGPSGATPVVSGDRVFLSSTDDPTKTCVALAYDRKSGKELWRTKIAEGVGKDRMSTYSNASPVTDGTHVWFFFGTGDLVCFDLEGKEIWARNIQKDHGQFAFFWTFSTSPVLFEPRSVARRSPCSTPASS